MPTIPTGSTNKVEEFVEAEAISEHGGHAFEATEEESLEEESNE